MQQLVFQYIREGEHLRQDFKFAVNDSEKIARSLSAFANTEGGRLLLGVKDNGNIVGVASDEEYYMIEAAAVRYCFPEVTFTTVEWHVQNKTVLEIDVHKSDLRPHYVTQRDGKRTAYQRVDDKNLAVNRIQLKVWQRETQSKGALITLNTAERFILDYLQNQHEISFNRFCKLTHLKPWQAERILVDFISIGLIEMVRSEQKTVYRLK